MGERRSALETGEVAKRSNAADCKSVALAASEVRILPSPPASARFASFGWASQPSLSARCAGSHGWRARRRGRARNAKIRVVSEGGLAPPKRRGGAAGRREGGSNSVVESQPSKLLVAGSIPVSRSIFWMAGTPAPRQARSAAGTPEPRSRRCAPRVHRAAFLRAPLRRTASGGVRRSWPAGSALTARETSIHLRTCGLAPPKLLAKRALSDGGPM